MESGLPDPCERDAVLEDYGVPLNHRQATRRVATEPRPIATVLQRDNSKTRTERQSKRGLGVAPE